MFSLPGQSLFGLERNFTKGSRIEPGTYFGIQPDNRGRNSFLRYVSKGIIKETEENLDRDMYYLVNAMLKENGYHRYEISNFAKKGI